MNPFLPQSPSCFLQPALYFLGDTLPCRTANVAFCCDHNTTQRHKMRWKAENWASNLTKPNSLTSTTTGSNSKMAFVCFLCIDTEKYKRHYISTVWSKSSLADLIFIHFCTIQTISNKSIFKRTVNDPNKSWGYYSLLRPLPEKWPNGYCARDHRPIVDLRIFGSLCHRVMSFVYSEKSEFFDFSNFVLIYWQRIYKFHFRF